MKNNVNIIKDMNDINKFFSPGADLRGLACLFGESLRIA